MFLSLKIKSLVNLPNPCMKDLKKLAKPTKSKFFILFLVKAGFLLL